MSAPTGNTTTYVGGIPVTRAAAEDEIFEANELTIKEQLTVDYVQLQAQEELDSPEDRDAAEYAAQLEAEREIEQAEGQRDAETLQEVERAQLESERSAINKRRRIRDKYQERADAGVLPFIELMRQHPVDKDHDHYEAYAFVYQPDVKHFAPTMQDVRERIDSLLEYPIKNGEQDRSAGPLPTTYNLQLVVFLDPILHQAGISEFGHHPAWRRLLPPWRAEVKSETYNHRKRQGGHMSDQINDHDWLQMGLRLKSYFGAGYGAVKKETVNEILTLAVGNNRFNTWLEHIDSLPEWDGISRLQQPFSNFDLTEDEGALLENFWLAAMHRWFNPGSQLDMMLVLTGDQGVRKSSLIRSVTKGVMPISELGGIPHSAKDKDDYAAIHASPVVAIDEVDRLTMRHPGSKGGTDAALKNLITTRADAWRDPYARMSTYHLRPSVFIGSTNHTEFIGDTTGDRRYYVVEIPKMILEEDLTREKMDLLLAEARDRYRAGEGFRYDEEFEAMAARSRARYVSDPIFEAIRDWIDQPQHQRHDVNNPGLTVDVTVIDVPLIQEQVKSLGASGTKSLRNDIAVAMDRMPGYQRVDLGGKMAVRRTINGKSKTVKNAWERVDDGTEEDVEAGTALIHGASYEGPTLDASENYSHVTRDPENQQVPTVGMTEAKRRAELEWLAGFRDSDKIKRDDFTGTRRVGGEWLTFAALRDKHMEQVTADVEALEAVWDNAAVVSLDHNNNTRTGGTRAINGQQMDYGAYLRYITTELERMFDERRYGLNHMPIQNQENS